MRLYAPVTSYSMMNTAVRFTQVASYSIPKTRWSVGSFSYERFNQIKPAGDNTLENFDYDWSVFASYQMLPKLAATLWSDVLQGTYCAPGSGATPVGWDSTTMDVNLGVGWDVTPKVNLNPQITFYPGTVTLDRTTIGMVISAKML